MNNNDSIKILSGMEAVRKRPEFFINSTDTHGLHFLIKVLINKSIEAIYAGFSKKIIVTLHDDGSASVCNPDYVKIVGIHKTDKFNLEEILTILPYNQHESAPAIVNALSEWLIVTINYEGITYQQKFKSGGKPDGVLQKVNFSKSSGISIRFKPDETIFSSTSFDFEVLSKMLQETAFLLKGTSIQLIDKRTEVTEAFFYEEGLRNFVEYINNEKEVLHPAVSLKGEYENFQVEIVFQFTDTISGNILSYVNNVRMSESSLSEKALDSTLLNSFNDYARKFNFLKVKDENIEISDIRNALTIVQSIQVIRQYLVFDHQSKDFIVPEEVNRAVENIMVNNLVCFLSENPEVSSLLMKKMIKSRKEMTL